MEMPVTLVTGNAGYTLLELVIVLAVLVLLAGAWPYAAPRLFPAQLLRDEAQQIIATFRVARTSARLRGFRQIVEFPAQADSYRSDRDIHHFGRGITLRSRTEGRTQNGATFTFYPDGSSSGGVLDLDLSNKTISVTISSVTGRAAILE